MCDFHRNKHVISSQQIMLTRIILEVATNLPYHISPSRGKKKKTEKKRRAIEEEKEAVAKP